MRSCAKALSDRRSVEKRLPFAVAEARGRAAGARGSVQNLSHFRFWLSGARPWLTR